MDIEQLSRSQTILLTLLVSFVTSIATGIVTVSLMDQAPPSIAQTVNRVIERTIQQVVSNQSAAAVVTQEKTVVVKESELVSQAVARATPSIVRLYSSDAENPAFLGLGIIVEASGTIAIDSSILGDSGDAIAELSNTSHVRTIVTSRDVGNGIAYLAPSATSTIEGKAPAWNPISISANNPILGTSVVALSGKTVARVAAGIVTSILPDLPTPDSQIVDTDINSTSLMSGSPLVDTNGSLIGISTSAARQSSASGFVTASVLMRPSSTVPDPVSP